MQPLDKVEAVKHAKALHPTPLCVGRGKYITGFLFSAFTAVKWHKSMLSSPAAHGIITVQRSMCCSVIDLALIKQLYWCCIYFLMTSINQFLPLARIKWRFSGCSLTNEWNVSVERLVNAILSWGWAEGYKKQCGKRSEIIIRNLRRNIKTRPATARADKRTRKKVRVCGGVYIVLCVLGSGHL